MSKSSQVKEDHKRVITEINKVEKIYMYPLLDILYQLVDFSDCFKEPLKAIYRKGALLPILYPNETYYKEFNFTPFHFQAITDLSQLDSLNLAPYENIVDKDCNVVIYYKEIKDKEKYLSVTPTFNNNIIMYIKDVVQNTITENLRYHLERVNARSYLSNKGIDDEHKLLEVLEYLLDTIYETIVPYLWNTFYIEISGTDLIIRQGLDYRIISWEIERFEKTHGISMLLHLR